MTTNSYHYPKKDNTYDYMAKLIIIGDSGVGKTNIMTRFCENIFKDAHVATIGVDFNVRTIQIEDKKIKLQVWDTAGQQRFKTITQTYYKGAAGIILVYAVDSKDSFESIQRWIQQVSQRTPPSVKKILVGNKNDCEFGQRQVSIKQGQEMAQRFGLQFIEVSAKQNTQIYEIFFKLGREIKDKLDLQVENEMDQISRTITLNTTKDHKQRSKLLGPQTTGCIC